MSKSKPGKKKKPLIVRILCGILAVLLAVILVAAATVFLYPLLIGVDGTQVEGSADWMAGLDDGIPLASVTLPGTHNAGTACAALPFFTKCQSLGVGEQLAAGFRYLDIRLAGDPDSGKLKLTHGFADCLPSAFSKKPLMLADVLEDCYGFLDAHPSECVLFCVKHEYGDLSIADMQAALYEEIAANRDRWCLGPDLPTVGEARGKLVLLRRWGDDAGLGEEAGIPFAWADQGNAEDPFLGIDANYAGELLLWVQDRYAYGPDLKWEVFEDGLGIGIGEDEAALHFLSTKGTLAYGHPAYFASRLNPKLMKAALPAGPVGWIVVDFGYPLLAERVYSHNFR